MTMAKMDATTRTTEPRLKAMMTTMTMTKQTMMVKRKLATITTMITSPR